MLTHVMKVEHVAALYRSAVEPFDRRAPTLHMAAQAKPLQRGKPRRLKKQARAHGLCLGKPFEDADIVAVTRQGDGGGLAGHAASDDTDPQEIPFAPMAPTRALDYASPDGGGHGGIRLAFQARGGHGIRCRLGALAGASDERRALSVAHSGASAAGPLRIAPSFGPRYGCPDGGNPARGTPPQDADRRPEDQHGV